MVNLGNYPIDENVIEEKYCFLFFLHMKQILLKQVPNEFPYMKHIKLVLFPKIEHRIVPIMCWP